MALDKGDGRKVSSVQRRVVRIVRCAKRSLDRDNLSSSVKNLLDGIKYAHLISDDAEKWIDLKVEQRKPEIGEEEHTLIEIYFQ